jgi:hypothetical protein
VSRDLNSAFAELYKFCRDHDYGWTINWHESDERHYIMIEGQKVFWEQKCFGRADSLADGIYLVMQKAGDSARTRTSMTSLGN